MRASQAIDPILRLATLCLPSFKMPQFLVFPCIRMICHVLSQDLALPPTRISMVYFYITFILDSAIWLALANSTWAGVLVCQFWAKALRVTEYFYLFLLYFCHLHEQNMNSPCVAAGLRMKKTCGTDLHSSSKPGVQPSPVWPSPAQVRACEPRPTCNSNVRKRNASVSHWDIGVLCYAPLLKQWLINTSPIVDGSHAFVFLCVCLVLLAGCPDEWNQLEHATVHMRHFCWELPR